MRWVSRLLTVVASGALLLLLAANLSACVTAQHAAGAGRSRIKVVEVGGRQALLVASYAYVAAARAAAARIRAGRMSEEQAARARRLGDEVRDALIVAHEIVDGTGRAPWIGRALSATAELVAIVEGERP